MADFLSVSHNLKVLCRHIPTAPQLLGAPAVERTPPGAGDGDGGGRGLQNPVSPNGEDNKSSHRIASQYPAKIMW